MNHAAPSSRRYSFATQYARAGFRAGAARVGWLIGLSAVIGLAVLGVVAMGGAGENEPSDTNRAGEIEWYRVQPRSFELTVTESGDLDAAERLEIKSKVEGRPEIITLVEEGSQVKAGDVLVTLDSDELRTKIDEAILAVEKARTDEIYARRGLEIERNEARSRQSVAEVNLALAKLELARWENGDVPQKRRELDLALQKAQRQVERTKRDFEISQALHAQKFISLNDLEDSEIAQLEAADALLTAELGLSVYDQYTFQTEEQQKLSDVDQAESDLEREIAKNESELARQEADLTGKTQTFQIRQEKLESLQKQLEASRIVAPQDGLVIYGTSVGRRSWRSEPMAEGRQVRYNETILYIPDIRQMVANLSIAEAYEPLVRVGQTVRVTVDARPGEVFEGVIDRTTPLAESGGWLNPGQREFTARVKLPAGLEADLKPAMRCTGEITVGQVDNALAVPVQAVFTEGDQHYCFVPAGNGRVKKQPVEIGRASETLVEITQGLADGDRVLLRNPLPGELLEAS
ncbi:MAG: efflux RND transporter periplasmic adaptor subunit [Planctomycetota bacterium]